MQKLLEILCVHEGEQTPSPHMAEPFLQKIRKVAFAVAGIFLSPRSALTSSMRNLPPFCRLCTQTLKGTPMKFDETITYGERADYCRNQATMTEDARLREYWNELAHSWNALDKTTDEMDGHLNARLLQPR